MDSLNILEFAPLASAHRPLLGLTVMVVEDSRFACDALRLLCIRSGARIRRADCLKSARRHLQVYRPSVAIIDLGLPDGAGEDLISELARAIPRVPVVLGISGASYGRETAISAGADGFLEKPVTQVGYFQKQILMHLPADRQPAQPRAVTNDQVTPDPIAYRDDMAHAADLLDAKPHHERHLEYVARFLAGVAESAGDSPLSKAANQMFEARRDANKLSLAKSSVMGLIQERIATGAVL